MNSHCFIHVFNFILKSLKISANYLIETLRLLTPNVKHTEIKRVLNKNKIFVQTNVE